MLIKTLTGVNDTGPAIVETLRIINMAPLNELIKAGWVEVAD